MNNVLTGIIKEGIKHVILDGGGGVSGIIYIFSYFGLHIPHAIPMISVISYDVG